MRIPTHHRATALHMLAAFAAAGAPPILLGFFPRAFARSPLSITTVVFAGMVLGALLWGAALRTVVVTRRAPAARTGGSLLLMLLAAAGLLSSAASALIVVAISGS